MPETEEVVELEKPDKSQKKTKSFLSKVVIRKLPPNLTSESFLEIISPIPDHTDYYFCAADWTLGAEATTRAYIDFSNEEDIFIFKDKFDGYVFVDSVRGSEYPALVEYAPFQGLPKARSRKKNSKHTASIETEQHFLNFLEALKKAEESEGQDKQKIEYSYQIKDDKKITSTPLIEFLAAKNQERREAKKKKNEEKRRQRDEERQKKKIQVAKNVPESVKEAKEEIFDDGIVVRTVPSRLGRNERKKDVKPEVKDTEKDSKGGDKRDKPKPTRDQKPAKGGLTRKERKREKEKLAERIKSHEAEVQAQQQEILFQQQENSAPTPAPVPTAAPVKEKPEKESAKEPPAKSETKRYSALRKARQEKTSEVKESKEDTRPADKESQTEEAPPTEEKPKHDSAAEAEKNKKKQERARERREREADARAQRHIKNKDRPTMQIYQPKRRGESDTKPENIKSSDEYSEASRKKSDVEKKSEKRERRGERRPDRRKSSRDETGKKKTSRQNSDEGAVGGEVDENVRDMLSKLALETPKVEKKNEVVAEEVQAEKTVEEKSEKSSNDV